MTKSTKKFFITLTLESFAYSKKKWRRNNKLFLRLSHLKCSQDCLTFFLPTSNVDTLSLRPIILSPRTHSSLGCSSFAIKRQFKTSFLPKDQQMFLMEGGGKKKPAEHATNFSQLISVQLFFLLSLSLAFSPFRTFSLASLSPFQSLILSPSLFLYIHFWISFCCSVYIYHPFSLFLSPS